MRTYNIGTVSVINGSKSVVGVGTLALANILIGDSFTTGDKWYEVESVESDTAWTLTTAHTGLTGSELPYRTVTAYDPSPPVVVEAIDFFTNTERLFRRS